MFTNPQMVDELQATALFTQDSAGLVRVDPAVLAEAARLLAESASPKLTALQSERDALGWSTFRMSIALRLIRTFGMGGVALPGSGLIRDWLVKWIDHGMDEQLAWPRAVPVACDLLTQWGFRDVQGFIGKRMATDKRAPVAANDAVKS